MDKTIIAYLSLAVAAFAAGWLIFLQLRLKKLFRGKKASDLEYLIAAIGGKLEALTEEQQKIKEHLNDIEKRLRTSVRKVGVIRFNPFEDLGGDQSFAIALLDERNNGTIITSLHGRERTMVYAKPIEKGKSTYNLTKEEAETIQKAITENESQTAKKQ
ncbi:MAG: DUF4446 family protein [Patescibacteria group bacterium]